MPVMGRAALLAAYQQLPVAQQQASVVVLLTTTMHEGELPGAGLVGKPLNREKVDGLLQAHFGRQLPPVS
jgi:hypothetical protein